MHAVRGAQKNGTLRAQLSPDSDGVGHFVRNKTVIKTVPFLRPLNPSAVGEVPKFGDLFAAYPGNGKVYPERLRNLHVNHQNTISTGHMGDNILPPDG